MSKKLEPNILVLMQGSQFPFGQIKGECREYDEARKILVQKRVQFRNERQKVLLESKLGVLKQLQHRNIINVRSVEQCPPNAYHIYYNYVPFTLQNAFPEIDYHAFKQLHRQVIHLAIHLAKNYILTSFHPTRCGVAFLDGQLIIKYYLPLNEIVITQNISILQRSVQLFKVQATHFLDALCRLEKSQFHSSDSDSFTLNPSQNITSHKRLRIQQQNRSRKLSNQPNKPFRRLSNTNSLQSLVSEARRKRSDSTNYSEVKIRGLKHTLQILKEKSVRKRNWEREKVQTKAKIKFLRLRSSEALKTFNTYKQNIYKYFDLLKIVGYIKPSQRNISPRQGKAKTINFVSMI